MKIKEMEASIKKQESLALQASLQSVQSYYSDLERLASYWPCNRINTILGYQLNVLIKTDVQCVNWNLLLEDSEDQKPSLKCLAIVTFFSGVFASIQTKDYLILPLILLKVPNLA
ncbi:hypothetical protein QVD17_28147 [Tagetes erecta]|uniref:Uncharacterized protein n=1 Tax=Tagetes erecta TaxID=13708 RepID=A0AAD8KAH4_TARER|nr:hypothetical protein QVD17_28147 [Tagetes erecta]